MQFLLLASKRVRDTRRITSTGMGLRRKLASIITPVTGRHSRSFGSGALLACFIAALVEPIAHAADDPALQPGAVRTVEFERDIRPILSSRCYGCHGPDKQKNDLRLDRRDEALKGGASGAVIVPRDSGGSLLIQYVSGTVADKRMPPRGEPLTGEQVELLRVWIDQGAVWPEVSAAPGASHAQDHWAFRALARPALPEPIASEWERNPVDRFVNRALHANDLAPGPEADRRTLLRRISFTLVGLPPTPEETEQFLSDTRPEAYARVVERLLASPHYGERWARHWLDVVRFAESAGFETNLERPNAWPYRDYVIAAFNEDKPYDQFLREQLAGDAFGVDEATGFLVGGPSDAVKSPDVNLTAQQRMDELHDMVATTGSAFLGLTIGCARCHNHKFDPISQTDYYAMQAIFAGVQHGERPLRVTNETERATHAEQLRTRIAQLDAQLADYVPLASPVVSSNRSAFPLRPPVHPRSNVDRFAPVTTRFIRFTIDETTGGEPCLDELEIFTAEPSPQNVALASRGAKTTASGTYPGNENHKLEHLNDGRFGNSRSWISSEPRQGWVQLELAEPVRIDRVVWSRDREGAFSDRLAVRYQIETALKPGQWQLVADATDREPFQPGAEPRLLNPPKDGVAPEAERVRTLLAEKQSAELKFKELNTKPVVYAGRFEQPGPTYRLSRGEPLQKREQVTPGVVRGLGQAVSLPADAPEQQRRLALAAWITDPAHPLTARVLVNRLWQHHFGQGLVSTPSDFGRMGARPTHPELLDWLACELIESGWSIKHVQRLMVHSATFRQSSRPNAKGLAVDAGDRWLWRYPPQRLEAEAIRDSILAVSGNLDARVGGRGFDLFQPNGNYVKVYMPKAEFGPAEWRRMIYQSKPRMRLDDTFGAFDCPDAGQVTPRRNVSTTPLQALNLLNSPFLLAQAERFAARIRHEAGAAPQAQIERAFRLVFQRPPSAEESAAATKLACDQGLAMTCRALLNANEFLFIF